MSAERAKLEAVVQTDVGVVRDHNEDASYADDEGRFFIVADGMGGHAAGEVASAMAVDSVKDELLKVDDLVDEFAAAPSDAGRKRIIEALERAVRNAHQAVYDRGIKETDKQGMGTTLDVLLIAGGDAFVAHVGDSRTYLLRDGKAAQITTDHTVAEVLVIEGKLSVEEAAASPLRTILVNAIGVAADVGVEMAHLKLQAGDRFLLCSDGLHDYFPAEQEIAEHVLGDDDTDKPLAQALDEMVELAKERGGHDNITGVLVEVESAPDVPDVDEQGPENDDAVPQEIARDDTMPVDVDELLAAEAKEKRDRELALATTGEHEAVNSAKSDEDDSESVDAEGPTGEVETRDGDDQTEGEGKEGEDGEDGDGDGDGDESEPEPLPKPEPVTSSKSKRPHADLKTTVPIRPLKVPNAVNKPKKGKKD
jgi:protein phosphatase